jgi:hypothetical protein
MNHFVPLFQIGAEQRWSSCDTVRDWLVENRDYRGPNEDLSEPSPLDSKIDGDSIED